MSIPLIIIVVNVVVGFIVGIDTFCFFVPLGFVVAVIVVVLVSVVVAVIVVVLVSIVVNIVVDPVAFIVGMDIFVIDILFTAQFYFKYPICKISSILNRKEVGKN